MPNKTPLRVGIVAGEKSGDFLGSQLIRAIRAHYPDAQISGLCGPLMHNEGAVTLGDMDTISIFGLEGLASALFDIIKLRRRIYKHFIETKPDVFIGIDVPDFNLGLEKKLKQAGIPTVHYVSPTVWAWRGGRIKKIRRAVDLMLTLFPFEETYYQRQNVPVRFVGHPLAKTVRSWQHPPGLEASLKRPEQKLIALLPGSRMSEVTRLAPIMLAAAQQMSAERPELQFVIPSANQKIWDYLHTELDVDKTPVSVIDGQSRELLALADMAILASGTAALEAGMFATPMVVMYKVAWLSALVFRHTITVEHYSMPNHLTNPPVVPELIEEDATVENVIRETWRLLDDPQHYASMQSALAGIAPTLDLDSGALATDAIFRLLEERRQGASA